eukprot:Sspe_Gene.25808::Locus_10470_Transcript_1_1_Confidence_1.000_Length_2535::g.25808::m.25808
MYRRPRLLPCVLYTILLIEEADAGFRGCYMANTAVTPPCAVERTESNMSFDWGNSTVLPPPYSVVWSGSLRPPPDLYHLSCNTSAPCRVWVDDHLMLDCLTPGVCEASYSLPIPFFSNGAGAVRIEYTSAVSTPGFFHLLANGTALDPKWMTPDISPAEVAYRTERQQRENGWGKYLSTDMLADVLLPHGVAVRLAWGNASRLAATGPFCGQPFKFGIHATGVYAEIEEVVSDLGTHRVETAYHGDQLLVVVTAVVGPQSNTTGNLTVSLDVPVELSPRWCSITHSASRLSALCPGFTDVVVAAQNISDGVAVMDLPRTPGDYVAFATGEQPPERKKIWELVRAARESVLDRFAKFKEENETYAGLVTAMAWNTIYTPYEGLVAPIFRGDRWSSAKPHGYLLFEWDTYLSGLLGVVAGEWVGISNIVSMTKAFIIDGYVPGYWNGKCGETNKSKPPVGGLVLHAVLQHLGGANSTAGFLVPLLFERLLKWNRWWYDTRFVDGLLAPGWGIRTKALNCDGQPPLLAAKCETGLDNSPMFDSAVFVSEQGVMSQWDVGMSALYARDCQVLAELARTVLGREDWALELTTRFHAVSGRIDDELWDGDVYVNKEWQTGRVVRVPTPTSFYPMLTGVVSDDKVVRMVARYLTNSSEFCVNPECRYGMPSVTRSQPSFTDNNYWRGRVWGPMNYLVYQSLSQYLHIPAVAEARRVLAVQSRTTFLDEWVANRRVMENYNSLSGEGCDVRNACPFYHWGALAALVPLLEKNLV